METPAPRRTPHAKWAAGALVLLAAIAAAVAGIPGPSPVPAPPSPPAEAVEPLRSAPAGGAGRVVCGFCNGDGRIDAADRRREAPRLEVQEGPCAACAGKGGK